ncbi:MAG TPA: hypothetical protein VF606_02745, partial [Geminicoccaceae bacterium]
MSSSSSGQNLRSPRPPTRRLLLAAAFAAAAGVTTFGPGGAGAADPTAEAFIERVGQRTVDILKQT